MKRSRRDGITPASRTETSAVVAPRKVDTWSAGLTDTEAARRRQADAKLRAGKRSTAVFTLHRFANPLVLILILASIASALLGEHSGAILILVIVTVSTALDFAQTFHSQRAADRLRQQVAATTTVKRNGSWRTLSPSEIVPGDRIRVQPGNLIPADAILVATTGGLFVQQSALTGESLPVEKRPTDRKPEQTTADPNDPIRLFNGTSVTSGSGEAVVTATGSETIFGQIAQRLTTRPPETEYERGMRELSLLIARAVFFLVLFVFLTCTLLQRPAFDSLLFAVALAVGLTPEFLPMITTVTLGSGALRMARRKVIVKRLQAIENLGGMDILCSDKTGTLTSDAMHRAGAVSASGIPSPRVQALGRLSSLLATEAGAIQGDALEAALLEASPDNAAPDFAEATLQYTLPFDFERRRSSVIVTMDGKTWLITKGAPEAVLSVCSLIEEKDNLDTTALTQAQEASCTALYRRFSEQGYRVLAVAIRELSPESTERKLPLDREREMTLVGFLVFENPPLPDIRSVLERLRTMGVTIKVLTGDNDLVTRHLCQTVGIPCERIVLGEEIEHLDEMALRHVAEEASVFARVSPGQKHRILLALKHRGHVVGYMGDGINDAPSLHAADVGISVAGAVDVARDAADIILLERSLSVLCDGIQEGRRAFGNVLKYLLMNLSSNFGNMISMAAAPLLLPFLPMLPTQILLNNFLYDLSQIAIPTDNVDEAMVRLPRRWEMRPLRDFMILVGPLSSLYDLLTFYILRTVFHASEAFFHTGWFIESLVTQTLVIFVIRTVSSSSKRQADHATRSQPSRALSVSVIAVSLLAMILPYTLVAGALGFVPMPLSFFGFVVVITGTYMALVAWAKRWVLGRIWSDTGALPEDIRDAAMRPADARA
jgi:Mg2+-importing ATPase